jgi:aryl-alcohol dehydrogenase
MQITAAVTRQAHTKFCIEEIELEGPREDEILVKIAAVGLCHTDLLVTEAVLPFAFPAVLGHEGAGIVHQVGARVTKVKPGDHVLMSFNSCGKCGSCTSGKPCYCVHFTTQNYGGARADGSSPLCACGNRVHANFFGQSSFASHAIGNERNVVKIRNDVDFAMLAPLGCGVQTGAGAVMRSLNAEAGSSIVIFGGGSVGLSAVMGAKIKGCETIILVEPVAARRQLGLELGATHVINPGGADVAALVRGISPDGVNYAVDTSGVTAALQAALQSLAMHGTLGLVGVPSNPEAELSVSIIGAISAGLTVKGIIEGDSVPDEFLPELVEHFRQGRLPLDKIVKTYPFADINKAVEDHKAGTCVKAVLLF